MSDFYKKLTRWFYEGNTGVSSKHMAAVACGVHDDKWLFTSPSDSDDFKRCFLLVEAVPEIREHFPAIAESGDKWRIVIDNWDRLVDSLKNKEDTTDLMRRLGI